MKFLPVLVVCVIFTAGCVSAPVYEPMHAAQTQTLLLNEGALKAVKAGMTADEVHTLMGQTIVIGYSARGNGPDYDPLTIPNPYKVEKLTVGTTEYLVEYYVSAVHQPDGKVSDDEIEPLVFKAGVLSGRGWNYLNRIRPRP